MENKFTQKKKKENTSRRRWTCYFIIMKIQYFITFVIILFSFFFFLFIFILSLCNFFVALCVSIYSTLFILLFLFLMKKSFLFYPGIFSEDILWVGCISLVLAREKERERWRRWNASWSSRVGIWVGSAVWLTRVGPRGKWINTQHTVASFSNLSHSVFILTIFIFIWFFVVIK